MPIQNKINAGTPISVSNGGTGVSSTTAYGVLCGGTTGTAAIQNAGAGTTGQFLVSNGASALPSFQNSTDLILLKTITPANGDTYVTFTDLDNTYNVHYFVGNKLRNAFNVLYRAQLSSDNGSTWITTNYQSGCGFCSRGSSTFQSNTNSTAHFVIDYSYNFDTPYFIQVYNIGTGTPVQFKSVMGNGAYFMPATGVLNSTSTINAIRFYTLTGTFTSGSISLYGQKS